MSDMIMFPDAGNSRMTYVVKKYKGRAELEEGLNKMESENYGVVSINHRFESVESVELFFVTYKRI